MSRHPFAAVDAVGIPWYRRDDYDAVREVMADGQHLPRTFEAWEKRANEIVADVERSGKRVYRAHIDAKNFRAWCILRGCNVDGAARGAFAADPVNWDRKDKH